VRQGEERVMGDQVAAEQSRSTERKLGSSMEPVPEMDVAGFKERDVFAINSIHFRERFPTTDISARFPPPNSTKKGFFRRLKEFRSGASASEAPTGALEEDTSHVITFSDKNVLGEGACAMVVRAHLDGAPVAAKILKKPTKYRSDVYSFDEAKASLIKEIELLAGLNHPHVVGLLGVFYEDQDIVMVQQLMRCSLKEYANTQSRLAGTRAYWSAPQHLLLTWATNLYDVLTFLHSRSPPIVHRDIKPDNLLIDENLNLRLGDFGLSRRIDTGSKSIQGRYMMTGCCGSLRYMAPEVQDDDEEGIALYNDKVDVYSGAMVLYFIATGHPPFHRQTAECAAATSIRGGRPTLSDVQHKYDPFLLEIIRTAWGHSLRRRPTSSQVLHELVSFKKSTKVSDVLSRATRLLSPTRRPVTATAEASAGGRPGSPQLSSESDRHSRRRSLSPTRWIGSVLGRRSQSPLRSPMNAMHSASSMEADGTDATGAPMSPTMSPRRRNFSGIFFRGSARNKEDQSASNRKGSISPINMRRPSDGSTTAGAAQRRESAGGEGMSFLRAISPSRLFRSGRGEREDGARSPVSSVPVSPTLGSKVKPKLCSTINADSGADGGVSSIWGVAVQQGDPACRRVSSFEDSGEGDDAGVVPDIIAPVGRSRKFSRETSPTTGPSRSPIGALQNPLVSSSLPMSSMSTGQRSPLPGMHPGGNMKSIPKMPSGNHSLQAQSLGDPPAAEDLARQRPESSTCEF